MIYHYLERRRLNRGNSNAKYQWVQPQTKRESKSGSPDQPMRKRTQQGGPVRVRRSRELINTAPTSKSKQGQQCQEGQKQKWSTNKD
ncbi:hypothetical protein TNCV_2747991 [Trichonephila clavipes]|nr:hypothetical protein TNCV_2747991 [Trichonephila clavipes]